MDYNLNASDYISVSGFQMRMHINTGMSIAANALVIYLILRHSTESMKSYRWCLLDMNMCYLLFDLHMTVIYQPLPIYKILGMCSIGMGRSLPAFPGTVLQMFIATLIMGACVGAILTAFLFRLLAVFNRMSLLRNPFVILSIVLTHLLATAPAAYGFMEPYLNDDTGLLTLTLESSPNESAEYPCFVGNREHMPMFLGFAVLGEVVFWVPLLFAVPVITFRRLKKEQSRMTARAYRVQKKLLVSLIVQVVLPSVTMVLPVVLLLVCAANVDLNSNVLMPTAFQIFTLHSFLNAIATIALTRPYREVVLGWLHLRKDAKAHIVSVVSLSSDPRRASTLSNRNLLRRISVMPIASTEARQ